MILKNKFIQKLLLFNDYLFFIIYNIAFLASIIESVKYQGFIQKHYYIGFNLLLYVTIASGILTLFYKPTKKSFLTYVKNYYYAGQLYLVPFIFIAWVVFTAANALTYDNFVFSKFHIIPSLLPYVLFLSLFMLIIGKLSEIEVKKNTKEIVTTLIISGFFAIFLFQNGATLFYILRQVREIIRKPNASYSEKMEFAWGSNIYKYVEFIKKNTPEDSTILIPPRDDPWGVEGNDQLMRGFLYPRKVISYNKKQGFPKEKVDYILLSWGFWRGSIDETKAYEFPNFDLKAKQIFIFDLKDPKVYQGEYNYKDPKYKKTFGLIKF